MNFTVTAYQSRDGKWVNKRINLLNNHGKVTHVARLCLNLKRDSGNIVITLNSVPILIENTEYAFMNLSNLQNALKFFCNFNGDDFRCLISNRTIDSMDVVNRNDDGTLKSIQNINQHIIRKGEK